MALADRHGLPLAVSTPAANHHEIARVQLGVTSDVIEAQPDSVIGDRACDPDRLDETLRAAGTEMIVPERSNRKRTTEDGGPAAPVRTRLDRRTPVRMTSVAATARGAQQALPSQFPRLRAAGRSMHAAQGILR
jgi:hypothetical protein